tara:strand:+ start:133 stop:474 length:342 start_codon:yes stop_codon:yes gene_type:complete
MRATAKNIIKAYSQWLTRDQEMAVHLAFSNHADNADNANLRLLRELDRAVDNHGVEYATPDKYLHSEPRAPDNRKLHYSNAGDMDTPTICWLESNKGLTLASLGDIIEGWGTA